MPDLQKFQKRTLSGLGCVLILIFSYCSNGCKRPEGSPAQSEVPAAPTTAEERLIARSAGKPGDPELGKEYRDINVRHFNNRLPEMPVLWEPGLDALSDLAAKGFKMEGLWGVFGSRTLILLNPRLQGNPEAVRRVLCHEMVHAHLNALGDSKTKHGQAFQKVLHRLSDEGAFTGIASEETEKNALRSWLDDTKLEIERIEGLLAVQREGVRQAESDFGALNSRIEAANAQRQGWPSAAEIQSVQSARDGRVAAYNSLIQSLNADVDRFNDEASRYNLMMAYPDGLDEERQVQPKTAEPPPPMGSGR